jgi:TPR repeat protein
MRKLLLLVLVLFASNAFGEAIADLRQKAAAGDAEAQTTLGVRYANGKGVRKDYKEAVKWYRKAAEQGDAAGQYNLGLMYRIGRGVPKDYVVAYAWYRLAAFSGFKGGSKSREIIAKEMTPERIAQAQELSKELLKKIEANKAKKK